jgi:hypothetical protein
LLSPLYGPPPSGSDEGKGDGRGASGVTAGPGGDIGRGAPGAGERGGSFDLAARRAFGLAAFLALRAGLLARRRAFTALRLRAGAAFLRFAVFFAFRLFAISSSDDCAPPWS